MSFLLKIIKGENAGLEIALAEGKVTFGSGEDCDIVLDDATLPEKAFTLETIGEQVSLIKDGEEAKAIELYTVFTSGEMEFAVGVEGKRWPKVKREIEIGQGQDQGQGVEEKIDHPKMEEIKAEEPKKKRCGFGCFSVLVLIILAFIGGYYLAQRYNGEVKTLVDEAKEFSYDKIDKDAVKHYYGIAKDKSTEYYTAGKNKTAGWLSTLKTKMPWYVEEVDPSTLPPPRTLEDVAADHALTLTTEGSVTTLSGNFVKRIDKVAAMQDAYEVEPLVKLDFSDDESLKSGVEDTLLTISEGKIKVVEAKNRAVKLVGKVETKGELVRIVTAICADVANVSSIDDSGVEVGELKKIEEEKKVEAKVEAETKEEAPAEPKEEKRKVEKKTVSTPNCPISGIITSPYPCIIMRDGSRAIEGAYVGEWLVVKIEANQVKFRKNGKEVTWRP